MYYGELTHVKNRRLGAPQSMFSMLRGLDTVRVNAEDVTARILPNDKVVTEVSLTLEISENRLTDVTHVCTVREYRNDKCIPVDRVLLALVTSQLGRHGIIPKSLKPSALGDTVCLHEFESLCSILDLYRGSKECTGWSSKTFRE